MARGEESSGTKKSKAEEALPIPEEKVCLISTYSD
jgi:hypothetical protein